MRMNQDPRKRREGGHGLWVHIASTLLFALTTVSPSWADSVDYCKQTSRLLGEASRIRQLEPKRTVPCKLESRAQIRTFLDRSIEEDLPPERLYYEEILFKAIGLIPESYDYKEGLVRFLVSQIGGYYDPKSKQFIMADWLPSNSVPGVFIHELTHALQDQYFNLLQIIDPKQLTTDESLARMALIEGDASAVMFDALRARAKLTPLREEQSVDGIILAQVLAQGVVHGVPESIKGMMLFPYTTGLRFVHALLREGGYSKVDEAFKRMPKTAREILHPEDYLIGAFRSELPKAKDVLDGKIVYSDVLGEFAISSIFAGDGLQKLEGAKAADGWMGDRAVIVERSDKRHIIGWLSRWETERDAQQFCGAFQGALERHYGTVFTETRTALVKNGVLSISCGRKKVFFKLERK